MGEKKEERMKDVTPFKQRREEEEGRGGVSLWQFEAILFHILTILLNRRYNRVH